MSDPLYRPSPSITDPNALYQLTNNDRVDVNASGKVSGVISGVPDITFIQNSLAQLPSNLINTNNLIANSCIARNPKKKGSFIITGAGGLPTKPDDPTNAPFPTYFVPNIITSTSFSRSTSKTNWHKGDPIIEPQGVYRLAGGQLVLSRHVARNYFLLVTRNLNRAIYPTPKDGKHDHIDTVHPKPLKY